MYREAHSTLVCISEASMIFIFPMNTDLTDIYLFLQCLNPTEIPFFHFLYWMGYYIFRNWNFLLNRALWVYSTNQTVLV